MHQVWLLFVASQQQHLTNIWVWGQLQGADHLPCGRMPQIYLASVQRPKRASKICLLEVHLIELRKLLERHHHGLRIPKKLTLDNFPFCQVS